MGAWEIAECLKENKSLRWLDIIENQIKKRVYALAHALKTSKTLTQLIVSNNKVPALDPSLVIELMGPSSRVKF